jgi:hypothetical protein
MIYTKFYKNEKIIIVSYVGGIDAEDIEEYEEFIHDTFLGSDPKHKLTLLSDMTRGKVTDRSITKRLGDLTQTYKSQTKAIYIIGLTPFMKILYKTYLVLSGAASIHKVTNETLKELCKKYRIEAPEF